MKAEDTSHDLEHYKNLEEQKKLEAQTNLERQAEKGKLELEVEKRRFEAEEQNSPNKSRAAN